MRLSRLHIAVFKSVMPLLRAWSHVVTVSVKFGFTAQVDDYEIRRRQYTIVHVRLTERVRRWSYFTVSDTEKYGRNTEPCNEWCHNTDTPGIGIICRICRLSAIHIETPLSYVGLWGEVVCSIPRYPHNGRTTMKLFKSTSLPVVNTDSLAVVVWRPPGICIEIRSMPWIPLSI